MTGGGVKCWGYNSDGQLGDGTTSDRYVPVDVCSTGTGADCASGDPLTGADAITLGTDAEHTCALTTTGGVKCWGRNEEGQLGGGCVDDMCTTPVDVLFPPPSTATPTPTPTATAMPTSTPTPTATATPVFAEEHVSESVDAGGTVTTDTESDGATASDPVETWVTSPAAGTVSIDETAMSGSPPPGFQFLGQDVTITAPAATVADPLIVRFRIDSSLIPPGENEETIEVFKNGAQVPACTGAPGTASPDPCVSERTLLPDSDVEITILTSTASVWNFGTLLADTDGDGCADVEELAQTNDGLPPLLPGETGGFDPNAWYDFYDVPVPANPDPTPNGTKNQAIAMDDVGAVLPQVPLDCSWPP